MHDLVYGKTKTDKIITLPLLKTTVRENVYMPRAGNLSIAISAYRRDMENKLEFFFSVFR